MRNVVLNLVVCFILGGLISSTSIGLIQTHVTPTMVAPPCPCPVTPARAPVVRIEADEKRGNKSFGTGTCIASTTETLIVTAWHVVRDGKSFKAGGYDAKLVAVDKTWDLAALTIVQKMPTVNVGIERPQADDQLTICGYGSGDYREVTGKLIRYFNPGGSNPDDILEVDVKARNGDSGGPIFDIHGNLAAVLFGSDKVGTHGSCCTRVRTFVEGLNIDPQLKRQALQHPYIIYQPHE